MAMTAPTPPARLKVLPNDTLNRTTPSGPLIAPGEAPAVSVERPQAESDFVLVCDHAGAGIPAVLGDLGLSAAQRASHIAWDIGAAAVARLLAQQLDAVLVLQNYSRLVIDCNRPLGASDSIAPASGGVCIPGNQNLDPSAIAARRDEVFMPYHDAIREILDRRKRARRPTAVVALHSFTPAYNGIARPWHIGVMHRRDSLFASAMIGLLARDATLRIGDNEPYTIGDDTDYTIPMHAEARGLRHLALEIRQDLLADAAAQKRWAQTLAAPLRQALAEAAGS